jgi:tRNA (uracil-5-)-methyltransferase
MLHTFSRILWTRASRLSKPIFTSSLLQSQAARLHNEVTFTPFRDSQTSAELKTFQRAREMNKGWRAIKADKNKRRKIDSGETTRFEGSNEEILALEVEEFRQAYHASTEAVVNNATTAETNPSAGALDGKDELELEVKELSSTGDGLAISKVGNDVYTVPFAIPGDLVRARVWPQYRRKLSYVMTDFVKVLRPSSQRDDSQINCKYFQTCSGCQFQMLPYEDQLEHKKRIVQKAFRLFSNLPPEAIPPVGDTIGSPLQYGYRTKLTPHFDGPAGGRKAGYTDVPPIGYSIKGRKKTMDIESCPIGTDIVQEGIKRERTRVADTIRTYKNGATLLIRETTKRTMMNAQDHEDKLQTGGSSDPQDTFKSLISKELVQDANGAPLVRLTCPTYIDEKSYTNDMNSVATEYVDNYTFTSRAGSFFQNNNSILSTFTAYVRDKALPPSSNQGEPAVKYLLDAYCGSGLFTITLSTIFRSALGIDIDPKGIEQARVNAAANNLENAGFIQADAPALFAEVPFPAEQTLVVIDPPRKGASEDFLKQLLHYGPKRVVYVSCNVHTQARDVGLLARGDKNWRYEIESLRGFDFFPQTYHVEGVCVLNRVKVSKEGDSVPASTVAGES